MRQRPRQRPSKLEAKDKGSRMPNRGNLRIRQLRPKPIINLVHLGKVQPQVTILKQETGSTMLAERWYQVYIEFLDKSF